jgi:glycosyltransferase involved in cell wall biosynthesis
MNKKPTVSVIIPAYNRAHLIGRAIKSVLNQAYQDFELIIIDDCSTDNTDEVVREFQKKDNRIIYLKHDQNKGGSAARNTGIKVSKSEYIAFLDSDDEWLPEKLEIQMEAILKQNVSMVTCFCNSYNDEGKLLNKYNKTYYGNPLYNHMLNNIAGTSLILVRKKDLNRVGCFENTPSQQDHILILKLLGIGVNIATVKKVLVKYHEHSDSRISGISERKIEGEKNCLLLPKAIF